MKESHGRHREPDGRPDDLARGIFWAMVIELAAAAVALLLWLIL